MELNQFMNHIEVGSMEFILGVLLGMFIFPSVEKKFWKIIEKLTK